jgi:hypothetical protein
MKGRSDLHDDRLSNLDNKDVPMPRPVFMMHKAHMAKIHDDPSTLGDKFEV